MFSFSDIKIINDSNRGNNLYSFIGIQKNIDNDGYEFWMPHGFDDFNDVTFNSIKKFFFAFYKTLKTYETVSEDHKKKERDGIIKSDTEGKRDVVNEANPIYFSKITMIDSIIDIYDELKIYSIINQKINTEKIDYTKIPDYLHKAVYMEDNFIYVDKMLLNVKQVKFDSSDIVSLYTYIYCEIKKELDEFDELPVDIKYISENFRYKYLNYEVTLFDENDFEDTIFELKNILEDIKNNSYYKDSDFWLFCDAVEQFLYGEFGNTSSDFNYWGTNMFWYIWEDMCSVYNVFNYGDKIIYSDSSRISPDQIFTNLASFDVPLESHDVSLPFFIQHKTKLNDDTENLKRTLRPDMIIYIKDTVLSERHFKHVCQPNITSDNGRFIDITFHRGVSASYDTFINRMYKKMPGIRRKSPTLNTHKFHRVRKEVYEETKNYFIAQTLVKESDTLQIIDFKYQSILDYQKIDLPKKVRSDLVKQIIYEKICQDIFGKDVEYTDMLVIPWYYSSDKQLEGDGKSEDEENLNPIFKDLKVELFKADFVKIQEVYNLHGKLL